MIDNDTIKDIKELSGEGLGTNQIANRLGISYNTVKKYEKMEDKEIMELREKEKKRRTKSKCDNYREEIIAMLEDFPEFSSAQIYDRLEEEHGRLEMAENTLTNYLVRLRKELDLPKPSQGRGRPRDYRAVEEAEPGSQAQVDFGEVYVRLKDNKTHQTKIHFACMSLSYSRYKYVFFQDHSFNAVEVVRFHQQGFEFFGGVPKELVYDQDARIVVDENYGEIVFTQTFQNYLNQIPARARVCRSRDPESKGKVENVVKYVKNNFCRGRLLEDMESWNEECLEWLERRANGKAHQTTKVAPRERFYIEQEALLELPENINIPADILILGVRKDNTVMFRGNRYDLPYGTYNRTKRVRIEVAGQELTCLDIETGEVLASHRLCRSKGKLIQLERNHGELTQPERLKRKEAFERLGGTEAAKEFIEQVTRLYPRYLKEQYGLIIKTAETWDNDMGLLQDALKECVHRELYSSVSFKQMVESLAASREAAEAPGKREIDWEAFGQANVYFLEKEEDRRRRLDYLRVLSDEIFE